MFKIFSSIALFLGLSVFSVVQAEEVDVYSEEAPGFNQCMDNSEGVTSEMLACYDQANTYWDKQLNLYYKDALKACDSLDEYAIDTPAKCKESIKKMQRSWLVFRDLVLDLPVDVFADGSGTMTLLVIADRKMELLKQQVGLLKYATR